MGVVDSRSFCEMWLGHVPGSKKSIAESFPLTLVKALTLKPSKRCSPREMKTVRALPAAPEGRFSFAGSIDAEKR